VIKPHSIDKEKKNGARKRPPKMEDTLSGLNQNQVNQYRPMPRPCRHSNADGVSGPRLRDALHPRDVCGVCGVRGARDVRDAHHPRLDRARQRLRSLQNRHK
jgi:hypothetical protein